MGWGVAVMRMILGGSNEDERGCEELTPKAGEEAGCEMVVGSVEIKVTAIE
jgi:hypothetical protein